MTAENNQNITSDNLPLSVREHLMRGQQERAIETLVNDYAMTQTDAETLITDYREKLRERKLALEVQVMQAENNREENERKQTLILWGVRIAVFVFVLALLLLLLK